MAKQSIADKNQALTQLVSPAAFPLLDDSQRLSDTLCSPKVAKAIENLRETLQEAYGCDYAFSILGKGHVLGASTRSDGVILAHTV